VEGTLNSYAKIDCSMVKSLFFRTTGSMVTPLDHNVGNNLLMRRLPFEILVHKVIPLFCLKTFEFQILSMTGVILIYSHFVFKSSYVLYRTQTEPDNEIQRSIGSCM
jgi:hypothetical protein